MAVAPFCIKQGGQLALSLQNVQDDGTPVDITGATITSQIRDQQGNLIATPTVTVVDAALGQFALSAPSDTTWPVGTLLCDVLLVMNSVPFYSDTFTIAVAAPVTAA